MLASVFSSRMGEVEVPGVPLRLDVNPGEVKPPCPDLGEHTEEILKGVLGMGDEEIGELKREGVI